ncbi:MAG TPA: acyl transferase [Fluviicola sp.]|nr:acyl transferase [Fluviicola sp.]
MSVKSLEQEIFAIQTEEEFNACALKVFEYQCVNIPVYANYIRLLNRPLPSHYTQIPCLPISFFKSHEILASGMNPQVVFKSSGTTGQVRSQHFVADLTLYERAFFAQYENFSGDIENQIIFALLPNYVTQGDSSLIYMVEKLIEKTKHSLSGFYLDDYERLEILLQQALKTQKKVVLFGVSYALLDFAEHRPNLEHVLVIETGGMKGRRKELTKSELHLQLKKGFNTPYISSEYGMCELLSQAYSDKDELFELPPWMRFSIRDVQDPFTTVSGEKTGGVNIVDLANLYSCAFIETQDLGRSIQGKLKLMGRVDFSEIRGCNLLVY